jgi:prophage regulatory protein
MKERFLRTKEVCAMLGITRPTLHKWMKRGKFPRSIPLSERTVAFRASEVEAWVEARAADRDHGREGRMESSRRAVNAQRQRVA